LVGPRRRNLVPRSGPVNKNSVNISLLPSMRVLGARLRYREPTARTSILSSASAAVIGFTPESSRFAIFGFLPSTRTASFRLWFVLNRPEARFRALGQSDFAPQTAFSALLNTRTLTRTLAATAAVSETCRRTSGMRADVPDAILSFEARRDELRDENRHSVQLDSSGKTRRAGPRKSVRVSVRELGTKPA
jgi:hypothetical protein